MVKEKKYSDLELLYKIYTAKQTQSIYRISKDLKIAPSTLHGKMVKLVSKGILITKYRGRKKVFLMNPVFVKTKDVDSVIVRLLPILKIMKERGVVDVGLAIDFILYASSEM